MNQDKKTGVNSPIQYKLIERLVKESKKKDEKAAELANIKIELEQKIACLNSAAIVSESDPDGNIIFANNKFCEISGYQREELIGKNHRILKSGKQPDAFFTDMMSTISSGEVFKGEVMNRKKGGEEFYWVDITIMPFKNLKGKIIKYVSIRFDITAQVQQKETLLKQAKELDRQNEEKKKRIHELQIAQELRRFIDSAKTPIVGLNTKGLINEWNHGAEEYFGYKKKEVLGSNWSQIIPENSQKTAKTIFLKVLKGRKISNYELVITSKDGKSLTLLVNTSVRKDTTGEIDGSLSVGLDITELVSYRSMLEVKVNERTIKLNDALEKQKELNQLKSKFVSTASHEFRTPLSAINFAAGSIKKYWTKMTPIMIAKKLHKIEDQVMHMTELLDDILMVGKAEAGKIIYNPMHINLGKFIFEIIEEVSNYDNQLHKIELIDTKELKNSTIFIDEKRGRNIFVNIINNAVKFSPDAKKVIIELSSEKDFTVIAVTDFGIGISEAELTNIFTPFTRGKNVDLIQGTGLGLSIVKDAIDAMSGKILILSTLGKGSTFIVKIPKN
jgi:PAS domain S-box-containing protein